jgi:hypothetical protein
MALIEAGDLESLRLGPVRVIDRLGATPREAVYRVFDPRQGAEAVLRHLAREEMDDAVHPDEFRQRFAAAAALEHPNVARVHEVLEVAGRPAALVEYPAGLPGSDWPALAAAPGAWYRLACQAVLGVQTAHQAGLAHAHLEPSSFVLTPDGMVKLTGLGAPPWLVGAPAEADNPAADLEALGEVLAGWTTLGAPAKGARAKPLPPALAEVLARLRDEVDPPFTSAAELLAELERAGSSVSGNAAAWGRLLAHVREGAAPADLRESA